MSENAFEENQLDSHPESTPASRMSRLLASMLDGLLIMTVTLPAMYFTGGFDTIQEGIEPTFLYRAQIGILGLILFVALNVKALSTSGQTIGKKALGIKIVDMENALPTKGHLLKRYAVFFIPGQVPIIGQLFSTVNIIFIFGKEKRCLHDRISNTKVINV